MTPPPMPLRATELQRHFIEALARRAAASSGALRTQLDARLAALRADGAAPPAQAVAAPVSAPLNSPVSPPPSPLAALLAHLDQHSPVADGAALPALKSLHWFRDTWTRLSADQRVHQAQARLPDNAGPMHSQRLLHRALTTMRECSPAYLEHFVAHADALLWLDQLTGGDVAAKKDVLLAAGERKRGRTRAR